MKHKQVFAGQVNTVKDFGRIPLYFIPNKGQRELERPVLRRKRQITRCWITKDGLVFDKIRKDESGDAAFSRVKSNVKNRYEADPYWNGTRKIY